MTEALSTFSPGFDDAFAAQLETLLHWRRDVRHFRADPVDQDAMRELLRIASLAPSVGHSQPWRFVQMRSPALRATLAAHVDAQNATAAAAYDDGAVAAQYRALKLHGIEQAPELLAVFCEDQPLAGRGLGIATMPEMLRYSAVMAIHTLWLAARARGIGMGWVSILDPAHVTTMLHVPETWALIAVLCIGYADEPSTVPELEQRGWQPREPWTAHVIER